MFGREVKVFSFVSTVFENVLVLLRECTCFLLCLYLLDYLFWFEYSVLSHYTDEIIYFADGIFNNLKGFCKFIKLKWYESRGIFVIEN